MHSVLTKMCWEIIYCSRVWNIPRSLANFTPQMMSNFVWCVRANTCSAVHRMASTELPFLYRRWEVHLLKQRSSFELVSKSGHVSRKEYFISTGWQMMTTKFHPIQCSHTGEGAVTVMKEDCGKTASKKLCA